MTESSSSSSSSFLRRFIIIGATTAMMMTTTMTTMTMALLFQVADTGAADAAAAAAAADTDTVDAAGSSASSSSSSSNEVEAEIGGGFVAATADGDGMIGSGDMATSSTRKLDSAFQRTFPPTLRPTSSAPTPQPTSPTTSWPTRHPTNHPTLKPTYDRPPGSCTWACGSLFATSDDGEQSCALGPYRKLSVNMEPWEFACNDGDGKYFSKSYYAPSFMYSFTLTQKCQYTFRDPTNHETGQDVEVRDLNTWFDAAAIKFQRPGHTGYKVSDDNIGFNGWHVPDYQRDLYKTKNAGDDSEWCPENYCVLVDGPSIGTVPSNYTEPNYEERRRRRNLVDEDEDNDEDVVWSLSPNDYHLIEGLDAIESVASDNETSAELAFRQVLRRNREVKVTTLDVDWSGDFWLPPADEVREGTKVQFNCGKSSEFTVHYNNGESNVRLIDYSAISNVALGKTATQSSTAWNMEASNAIDENMYTATHTGYDLNPYLEIDLQQKHYIKEIKVWNRLDWGSERLRNFVVDVYQGSNITWSSQPQLGTPPSTTVDVPNVAGDRVKISIPGRYEYLMMKEVEIFGIPWPPPPSSSISQDQDQSTSSNYFNNSSNSVDDDRVLLLIALEDAFDTARRLWYTESTYVSDEEKYRVHAADDSSYYSDYSITNVALGKTATQSSTHYSDHASRAIDGTNTTISHTSFDADPFWQVDLRHNYYIKEIKVWNRIDWGQERLRDFVVEIYQGSNVTWSSEPYEGTPPAITTFDVPSYVAGDTVKISIFGRYDYLMLREVEVFGAASHIENLHGEETIVPRNSLHVWTSDVVEIEDLINIARGKMATQSSTWYGQQASRAIDGNYDVFSHTSAQDYEPYWEVDLERKHYIKMIKVWNRADWGPERLRGFVVDIYQGGSIPIWSSEPHEGTPSRTTTIDVPNIVGDKVRVSIPGRNEYLMLAEVEVFGVAPSTDGDESIAPWEPTGTELIYAFSHKDAARDFHKMLYDTMRSSTNRYIYSTNHFLKCGCESFCLDARPTSSSSTCYVEDACGATIFKIAYPDDFPDNEKVSWVETGTTDVMDWFSACAYGQFRCNVHPNSHFESFRGIDPTSDRENTFPQISRFDYYQNHNHVYGLGGNAIDGFQSSSDNEATTDSNFNAVHLSNCAVGKTATQSSSLDWAPASNAVDGSPSGSVSYNGRISHTHWNNEPYWEVDLEENYHIKEIKVWNRMDWGQERLRGFVVEIYQGSNVTWSSEPYEGTPPETTTIDVPNNIVGDKVKISIPGRWEFLMMKEVQVFGYVQPRIMWTCPGQTARDKLHDFGKIVEQAGFMRGNYKKPPNSVPTKPCVPEIIDPPEEPQLPSPVGPNCEDVDHAGYCMSLSFGTCFIRRPIDPCFELDFVIQTTAGVDQFTSQDVEEWTKACIEVATECTPWEDSTGEITYNGGPKAHAKMFDDVEGWILRLSNRLVNGQNTMKNGEIHFDCLTWESAYEAKNFTDGAADRYKVFGNRYGDLFTVNKESDRCTDEPTNFPTETPTLSSQPSGIPTIEPTVCAESYLNSENLNIALVIDLSFSTYEKTFSSEVDIGDVNGDGKGNTILDAQVVAIQDLLMSIAESPSLNNSNCEISLISFETDAISHGVWQPLLQGSGDAFNPELMNYIKQELRAPIKNDTVDEVRELNNGYTNFDAALDRSVEYFKDSATPHRLNLMVFLSDGEPNVRGDGDAEMYCTDKTTFWNDDNPGTEYNCADLGLQPGERHTSCRGNDRNCVDNNKYQDCVRGPNFCFYSEAVQQYDSELAELDDMKVARLAIGVGDESNVTEGSALWVIDDNPGKEQGILPERVLSLEELSSALKYLCILNTDPPTGSPSADPTASPTASPAPSKSPTDSPTDVPTDSPIIPTDEPSTDEPEFVMATPAPTPVPSSDPTGEPTSGPTDSPSGAPTTSPPTSSPSKKPTNEPTEKPTKTPTTPPSAAPSGSFFPSTDPTENPTKSQAPTDEPTNAPTTRNPTNAPSSKPTLAPTFSPTSPPTSSPSGSPTGSPTGSMQPTFMLPDCYDGPKLIEMDNDSAPMCYYNRDVVQVNEMNINNVTIAINNVWTANVLPQQVQVFIHTSDVGDIRKDGDGFQCLDKEGTDVDVEGENELNVRCYQEESGNATSPFLATIDVVISDPNIHGSNDVRHPCFPDLPIPESCSWTLIIPCDYDDLCTNEPTTQPSAAPTLAPTEKPTESPTKSPSTPPTETPTQLPTASPTGKPQTAEPTSAPISETTTSQPFEFVSGECPEYAPPECPEDIILIKHDGVTQYPDDAIRVLSQDTTSVTVELRQPFTKSSPATTIDYIFYQYQVDLFDQKCYEETDVDCNSKIEIKMECMRSKPIALFELWVADNDVLDSTGDNAIIPECCHPDDAEGKPAAMYLIEIKCATACPEELQ